MNKLYQNILILVLFVAAVASLALAAGVKLSLNCAGQNDSGIWRYVCTKTEGDYDTVLKSDSSGVIAVLGLAPTGGDVIVQSPSTSAPRIGISRSASGELKVTEASGRTLFSDFQPYPAPILSPSMPSVLVLGDLPPSTTDKVSIDLRSPSAEISGGRAVFVGNAPNISVDVSGRNGANGRSAGAAAAIQVASGAFGSGETAKALASNMQLSATPSSPELKWNDLSPVAANCAEIAPGYSPFPSSPDGGTSFVVNVPKAKDLTVSRNICERVTSKEISIQSTCVRPGEIASTVNCSFPDIVRRAGVYARDEEEKMVSFSCAAGVFSGIWDTTCGTRKTAIVTAAIRPDYIVLSPSSDIATGMSTPLRHNFPNPDLSPQPCGLASFSNDISLFDFKVIGDPLNHNYLDFGGFSFTGAQPVSAGGLNQYMKSIEFSSYTTPSAPAFPSQTMTNFNIKIDNGTFVLDNCGRPVTKLDKIAMAGGLISQVTTTVPPGSQKDIKDRSEKKANVANLGYWASHGSKAGNSTTLSARNVTDAAAVLNVSAQASSHDSKYLANREPNHSKTVEGRIGDELIDLGFKPFGIDSAVVSYEKLTVTKKVMSPGENTFKDALRPMLEESGEATKDSNDIATPALEAFISKLVTLGGSEKVMKVLNTRFRERITYEFTGLRIGLATQPEVQKMSNRTVYRAITKEAVELPPRAIYIPGDFAAKPITISKYCNTIDIDDQPVMFRNGDSVTLGGVEMPNGNRINMRSTITSQSIQSADESSDHESNEAPNNIFSGWGMSFLKMNKIPLREKNSLCETSIVSKEISVGQASILNKIKNSSGLLLVAYKNTISVYFSPTLTPKPGSDGTSTLWMNTGISDGMYMPRINVAPAIITDGTDAVPNGSRILFGNPNPNAAKSEYDKPMILPGTPAEMKVNFADGVEFYDLPSYPNNLKNKKFRSFSLEGTRSLTGDGVNASASDPAGSEGDPVSATKYIKSLRKMSLAAAPSNPALSVSTVKQRNDGGLVVNAEAGTPEAILVSHLGVSDSAGPVQQDCTGDNLIRDFHYPTKLVSRRALGTPSDEDDLDMNTTRNKEVSGPNGPLFTHDPSIGFFSRPFLPTTMTFPSVDPNPDPDHPKLEFFMKNRSDPYYTARDYNSYLADIQQYSSRDVERQTNEGTETLTIEAISEADRPYDMMISYDAVVARLTLLARQPAPTKGDIDMPWTLVTGDIDLFQSGDAVLECLRRPGPIMDCFGSNHYLSPLTLPFSAVAASFVDVPRPPTTAAISIPVERFITGSSNLMTRESSLFLPLPKVAAWYTFYKCLTNTGDVTGDRSADCTEFGWSQLRTGQWRNPFISLEAMDAASILALAASPEKVVNKPYFSGMLAPHLASNMALFTQSKDFLQRQSNLYGYVTDKVSPVDVNLIERPSGIDGLTAMNYSPNRINSIGGELSEVDGGATSFEGNFALPLMGTDTKMWLQRFNTGGVQVSKSGTNQRLSHYTIKGGSIDAFSVLTGSSNQYITDLSYKAITRRAWDYDETKESPPPNYDAVVMGITPYATAAVDEAPLLSSPCTVGDTACSAASRLQKAPYPSMSDSSGDATIAAIHRVGMSAYMFKGCSDNLKPGSIIHPDRNPVIVETTPSKFLSNDRYSLYLPSALRDSNGPYFGPVHGPNLDSLDPAGIMHNALVVQDLTASGRIAASVDVYKDSIIKRIAELPFSSVAVTIYGDPRAVTLGYALSQASEIVNNPATKGSYTYENPLALTPDVLLGIFAHENLGNSQSVNPDTQTSSLGQRDSDSVIYLNKAVDAFSSSSTKSRIASLGYSINTISAPAGSASGMIFAPKRKEGTLVKTDEAKIGFSWIVSNESILATVVSSGVSDGAQHTSSADSSTLSGGVVNGYAGGVAIDYGVDSLVGLATDTRPFTDAFARPAFITRSSGIDPVKMSGAGFVLKRADDVLGISAKLSSVIDGTARVDLGKSVSIENETSGFFLADEICGEVKFDNGPTSTDAIQNTLQFNEYCAGTNGSVIEGVVSSADCTCPETSPPSICGKAWIKKRVKMSADQDRVNPYASVCSYAAITGRQTNPLVASRWLETQDHPGLIVDEIPSKVCPLGTSTNAFQLCKIDQINVANNNYWEIQEINDIVSPSIESDDSRSPSSCPNGSVMRSQKFTIDTNPTLLTFTAMNSFAGADLDATRKPICPSSCSIVADDITTSEACLDPSIRTTAASRLLAVGAWGPMNMVASVNVPLFSDKSLCYSIASGASVPDLRTEKEKVDGKMLCGGIYNKCSLPGRFSESTCISSSLPGGAGQWETGRNVDSTFLPSQIYGKPTNYEADIAIGSPFVEQREGDPYYPYRSMVGIAGIGRIRASALDSSKTTLQARVRDSVPDNLGLIWVKESDYNEPICSDIHFDRSSGHKVCDPRVDPTCEGPAPNLNDPDIEKLQSSSYSSAIHRRFGAIDALAVITKARQVSIEDGAGAQLSSYADSCDFTDPDIVPARDTPMPRVGFDQSLDGSLLSLTDFSQRIDIKYVKGEAVSVTRRQATPWSSENINPDDAVKTPECSIFNDPTVKVSEKLVSFASDASLTIGNESNSTSTKFKANPISFQDSSLRNEVQDFAYGGQWLQIASESLQLTRSNSTSMVSCRIYGDSKDGNDACDSKISMSVTSVDGPTLRLLAENGENGGSAGSAVVLTTTRPATINMLSNGGSAGSAGGTDLAGSPDGKMMCYALGTNIMDPILHVYRFRQSSSIVSPGSSGQIGQGNPERSINWWGVMPESRKWLQKTLQNQ